MAEENKEQIEPQHAKAEVTETVIQFTDVNQEQIKFEKQTENKENKVIKYVDDKPNPVQIIRYYKSDGKLVDRSNMQLHYVQVQDRLIVSQALQKWDSQNYFKNFRIDYVPYKKRCDEDHGELIYKSKAQLAQISNKFSVGFNCNECNGFYESYVGSYHCTQCLYNLCIPCYYGEHEVIFRCEDGHKLSAHRAKSGTCNTCLIKTSKYAVVWTCDICEGKPTSYLCTRCYTKGSMLVCNGLHTLSKFTKKELLDEDEQVYMSGSIECAQCNQIKTLSYGSYHCSFCNFDLCDECEENKKKYLKKLDRTYYPNKCHSCLDKVDEQKDKGKVYCEECSKVVAKCKFYKQKFRSTSIKFRDEYAQFMPQKAEMICKGRAGSDFRFGWGFNETKQNRKEEHVCYVKINILQMAIDENYETETATCELKMNIKCYWLFDFADYTSYWQKKIDLVPKKWSKWELDRPWEPIIECEAPAELSIDEAKEDIEFTNIRTQTFFGDEVLSKESKEEFSKTVGFLRSACYKYSVTVDEPLELESYPFDEQDVPITFTARNFSRFIPALHFPEIDRGGEEKKHFEELKDPDHENVKDPVIEIDGRAVSVGNWEVQAVVGEFATINNNGHDKPISDLDDKQMTIRIKFKRDWQAVLITYAFLIFCVSALSLTAFVFETDDYGERLALQTSLILTLVFVELPTMPVVSILHWYYSISFLYLVIMTVQAAFSGSYFSDVDHELFYADLVLFGVYHIIFIFISIKISYRELTKVVMTTKQLKEYFKDTKNNLMVKTEIQNDSDMLNKVTIGIFTKLSSFLKKKIVDNIRDENPHQDPTVYQLAHQLSDSH